MYLLKVTEELQGLPTFIASDDLKHKNWFVSEKPTIFLKLKDARKLRKRILENKGFEGVDVYKITKMKSE